MKSILIHTHFHKRRTGVTRSIENVLPYFETDFESYVFGNTIKGRKIGFSKLRKLLFSDRKVIVHCHRNNEILRMLILRFFGAKFTLIASRHSATKPSKLTFKLLQKSDKVVTLIKNMSNKLGLKNTIIGHGIDSDFFVPNSKKKLENISQEQLILCAGRVRKSKGHLVLLEAGKVLKKHPNWALVIVGKVDKPSFLTELKLLTKKYSIKNQVYFIPETSDIISYYQTAKISIIPSFSEGFSLVTAEAMACECTVIATKNVGVHSEMISDQKNGYLFEAGNASELQENISKLIKKELPMLGENARKTIIENWSAQKEAENLTNLYLS